MKTKEIAKKYNFDEANFNSFCCNSNQITIKGFLSDSIDDSEEQKAVALYRQYLIDQEAKEKAKAERQAQMKKNAEQIAQYCTTTDGFDNAIIEKYLGTVDGVYAYASKGSLGGILADTAGNFHDAFISAKNEMTKKALSLGANAIVGLQITTVNLSPELYVIVAVTGTAVFIKNKDR